MQWAWHFFKNSTAAHVKRSAPHLNNILTLSRGLINDMRGELGNNFDMEEKGCFMLCKQQKTLAHEFHLADDAEKLGLKVERLNAAQVQALEPDVEWMWQVLFYLKTIAISIPGKLMRVFKNIPGKSRCRF